MIKICISVTSHALDPSLCHKLSHLLGPPPPLERDVLYGRPLIKHSMVMCSCFHKSSEPLKTPFYVMLSPYPVSDTLTERPPPPCSNPSDPRPYHWPCCYYEQPQGP